MTTPTLLTREVLGTEIFTSHRALFVTPRGGCGVRVTYRINGERVTRQVWEARREAALSFSVAA